MAGPERARRPRGTSQIEFVNSFTNTDSVTVDTSGTYNLSGTEGAGRRWRERRDLDPPIISTSRTPKANLSAGPSRSP